MTNRPYYPNPFNDDDYRNDPRNYDHNDGEFEPEEFGPFPPLPSVEEPIPF